MAADALPSTSPSRLLAELEPRPPHRGAAGSPPAVAPAHHGGGGAGGDEVRRVLRSGGIVAHGVTIGLAFGNMSAVLDPGEAEGIASRYGVDGDGAEVQAVGAMLQVGCVAGSALGFAVCDARGRRAALTAAATAICAGALVAGAARSVAGIAVGRLVGGVGTGMACHSVPIYVSEMAEERWRARLDSAFQVTICAGVLTAYALNVWFMQIDGGHHLALGMQLPFGVAFFLSAAAALESPRWLAAQPGDDAEEAARVLRRVRASEAELRRELAGIRADLAAHPPAAWRDLAAPGHRRVVAAGVTVCALQGATGIDLFGTYASRTFAECGWEDSATLAQVLVGATLLLCTVAQAASVRRVGARAQLLCGASGMGVAFALLAFSVSFAEPAGLAPVDGGGAAAPATGSVTPASYATVAAMLLVPASFSFSWGPLAFLIPNELFSNRVRAKAMSVGQCLNWTCDWVVLVTFLPLKRAAGPSATYAAYAVINFLAAAFAYSSIRDHRGLTLEQVQGIYSPRHAAPDGATDLIDRPSIERPMSVSGEAV